ncbi:MAG: sulfatase-like hydrolase/transferase, partial [Pseudomonadota bacterium]
MPLTAADKPNIIIILADDLGWNDVGYHNPEVSTPNIDTLAEKGIELDRFYVDPTCSPTRASLMTGMFATTHGVNSPVQWHTENGLPLDFKILPE